MTFNFQKKYLGEKIIDSSGEIGTFIGRCDEPSFTVEFENGRRVSAGTESIIARGFKLYGENKEFDMGLGYRLMMDKNGWVEYSQGDKKMKLINCKKDLDILQEMINMSRKIIR